MLTNYFCCFIAFGFTDDEIRHIIIKINDSGLMKRGHDSISKETLQQCLLQMQKDTPKTRGLTVHRLEHLLLTTNYLLPLNSDCEVLRFNTKNFQKVIQDDLSKYKFIVSDPKYATRSNLTVSYFVLISMKRKKK